MPREAKYKGENPLTRLHEGEPFFFIRAQDKFSVEAVMAYAKIVQKASDEAAVRGDEELSHKLAEDSTEVIFHCNRFLDWREANPDLVKIPD